MPSVGEKEAEKGWGGRCDAGNSGGKYLAVESPSGGKWRYKDGRPLDVTSRFKSVSGSLIPATLSNPQCRLLRKKLENRLKGRIAIKYAAYIYIHLPFFPKLLAFHLSFWTYATPYEWIENKRLQIRWRDFPNVTDLSLRETFCQRWNLRFFFSYNTFLFFVSQRVPITANLKAW